MAPTSLAIGARAMPADEFFDDVEPLNTFGQVLDELVISAYSTASPGISKLDQQWRDDFKKSLGSPEMKDQLLDWWSDRVSLLRYHIGNMGLVSLLILFDRWLLDFYKRGVENGIFTKVKKKAKLKKKAGERSLLMVRILQVEQVLQKSSLSAERLREIIAARDAIVHHDGGEIVVADELINEVPAGKLRVAIDGEILIRVTKEIEWHTDAWFQRMRAELRAVRAR